MCIPNASLRRISSASTLLSLCRSMSSSSVGSSIIAATSAMPATRSRVLLSTCRHDDYVSTGTMRRHNWERRLAVRGSGSPDQLHRWPLCGLPNAMLAGIIIVVEPMSNTNACSHRHPFHYCQPNTNPYYSVHHCLILKIPSHYITVGKDKKRTTFFAHGYFAATVP